LFSLGQTIPLNDSSDDETIVEHTKERNQRPRSMIHSDETVRNGHMMKKSSHFIQPVRKLFHRISNRFRRQTHTADPVVQREISCDGSGSYENIYETISPLTPCDSVESVDFCSTRIWRRSPPQVTWKHSWPTVDTRDALLNSPFSSLSTEMFLHIFPHVIWEPFH
jgi:hypothetical protein